MFFLGIWEAYSHVLVFSVQTVKQKFKSDKIYFERVLLWLNIGSLLQMWLGWRVVSMTLLPHLHNTYLFTYLYIIHAYENNWYNYYSYWLTYVSIFFFIYRVFMPAQYSWSYRLHFMALFVHVLNLSVLYNHEIQLVNVCFKLPTFLRKTIIIGGLILQQKSVVQFMLIRLT